MTSTTAVKANATARFGELLDRHRGMVLKVASSYCRNPADRDTWMYRIALNVAISFVSNRHLRERHSVALDERWSSVSRMKAS